jgi:hypothetical protein
MLHAEKVSLWGQNADVNESCAKQYRVASGDGQEGVK